jgi:hypothetical protein
MSRESRGLLGAASDYDLNGDQGITDGDQGDAFVILRPTATMKHLFGGFITGHVTLAGDQRRPTKKE